jgi:hypothetical protein
MEFETKIWECEGSWIVYAKSDWPRIKAAIIEHVRGCE